MIQQSDQSIHDGQVLVVDDDRLVASALSQALRREGLVVVLASNMDEALENFTSNPIDVVLTDLIMPGGTGLDLLRQIEQRDPLVPVIIITADDSVQPAAEAVRKRAFDYLTKPVSRRQLSNSVHRAFKARRNREHYQQQQQQLLRDKRRLEIQNRRRSSILSVLFDRAIEGIIIWDQNGRIVDASESFSKVIGLSPDQLASLTIDDLFDQHPSDISVSDRVTLFGSGTHASEHWQGDVWVRRHENQSVRARLSLSVCDMPEGDSSGISEENGARVRYIVGLLHHDSAQEQLSRQLQRANRLATVGLLAGSAAHEIKNDLGPLLGYISLFESDDQDGMIGLMRESIRRIQAHVEQVLSPLRPRIRQPGPLILQKSIDQIVDGLRRTGKLRRVKLTLPQYKEDDPVVVYADKDEVHQIGINLITNAVDALRNCDSGHKGSIEISITRNDQYGILEIRDDGDGIPSQFCPRVFEPFFTTKDREGTGLGLTVVHDLVRRLHGSVSLHSKEGEGTTIQVRLPLFLVDPPHHAVNLDEKNHPNF